MKKTGGRTDDNSVPDRAMSWVALLFGTVWLIGIPLRDALALARDMAATAVTGTVERDPWHGWLFYRFDFHDAWLQPVWATGAFVAVVWWVALAYRAAAAGRWGLVAAISALESAALAVFFVAWLYLPWLACSYTPTTLRAQAQEAPDALPALLRFFLVRA